MCKTTYHLKELSRSTGNAPDILAPREDGAWRRAFNDTKTPPLEKISFLFDFVFCSKPCLKLGRVLRAAGKTFLPWLTNPPAYAGGVSALFSHFLHHFSLERQSWAELQQGRLHFCIAALGCARQRERLPPIDRCVTCKENGCITSGSPICSLQISHQGLLALCFFHPISPALNITISW
jgi:hypothetical protein